MKKRKILMKKCDYNNINWLGYYKYELQGLKKQNYKIIKKFGINCLAKKQIYYDIQKLYD